MKAKKGNKGERKCKKEKGGTRSFSRPKKKLKQSNLIRVLVESLDVEGFGDHFQVQHPSDLTCVSVQNCGPQPHRRHTQKSRDGAMAISGGEYVPKLDAKQGWHDRMCMTTKREPKLQHPRWQ